MPNILKKYPLALLVFVVLCYLSFFKPPSTGLPSLPHLDKVVHFCMYFGFSSVIWFEFLRAKKKQTPALRGWGIGFVLPVLTSGIIELLQEYCTTYRGGEWLDFLANSLGALGATLLFYYVFRKHYFRA